MQQTTKEVLKSFSDTLHINIALYDENERCLYRAGDDALYCGVLHRSRACYERCLFSDKAAFARVKKSKEPYVYTCPFGMYEAIFPILDEKKIRGYLFFGGGRMLGDEEMLALAHAVTPELSAEKLIETAHRCPYRSPEEWRQIECVVEVLAAYLAESQRFVEDERTYAELVKWYVAKNLSEKITLSEIARFWHCSPVTLTQHFRRECGMTIMEYVLAERMKLARRLLSETALPVTAVGVRCGFQDVEYFSKCFKKENGLSPTAWREKQ